MLFHTRLAVELEVHPLLLISAEVPYQHIIRAKHLRSLGFKALVPTATITQLFTSIVFANIPCTCIFCYSIPHSFLLPTVSSSSSLPDSSQWPPASTHIPSCAAKSLLSITARSLAPSASAIIESVLPTCHHPTHSASAFMCQSLHDRNAFNRLSFSITDLPLHPTSCYLP